MIQGKVVSVALDVDYPKKDGGGSYQAFVLKYVNGRNEVREIVKPMQGLKYKPTIAKVLRELVPGDTFSLQMEKNKAGYDDIVGLQKGEAGVDFAAQMEAGATGVASARSSGQTTGKVLGSTYETPEERKIKQRLIVRQSSFSQAATLNPKGKVEDLFAQAEAIENWVYRGME